MVEINVVYTKTGDDGTTGLADGSRIPKDSALIEAIGTVDELNSQIGLAISTLGRQDGFTPMQSQLKRIQNELFNLGSELALQIADGTDRCPCIQDENITTLETSLDQYNATLPALTTFVLPGGSDLAARLHVCRTVCRRAERRLITSAQHTPCRKQPIQYLNRLSDWLFVAARWTQAQLQLAESLWTPPK